MGKRKELIKKNIIAIILRRPSQKRSKLTNPHTMLHSRGGKTTMPEIWASNRAPMNEAIIKSYMPTLSANCPQNLVTIINRKEPKEIAHKKKSLLSFWRWEKNRCQFSDICRGCCSLFTGPAFPETP